MSESMGPIATLVFFFVLLVLGWACHVLKKWDEARQKGHVTSLRTYFMENPAATYLSICAPLAVWLVMAFTGELLDAPIMGAWASVTTGWFGNSAADMLNKQRGATRSFTAKADGE